MNNVYIREKLDVKLKKPPCKEERYGYQIIINTIFRFLQKLGYIPYVEEPKAEEITVKVIQPEKIFILDEFYNQCRILKYNYQEPKSVIVGNDYLDKLYKLKLEHCYNINLINNRSIDGVKLILVPHFKGMLVLPYTLI